MVRGTLDNNPALDPCTVPPAGTKGLSFRFHGGRAGGCRGPAAPGTPRPTRPGVPAEHLAGRGALSPVFPAQRKKHGQARLNRPPFVRQYGILLTNGVLFMPKGVPNKRYTGEFKQEVVETMQREKLSYKEVARLYGITAHDRVASWERIYLEEGPEGLYIERRGRGSKGSPPKKLKPEVEEDLLAEVQRLRAENAYLKKLNALVAERVRQERKQK